MASRTIVDLRWARELDERPKCIPKGRPRGVKKLGVRYERAFGEAVVRRFPEAKLAQWFEFEDANGHGYCQTDVLVEFGNVVVVVECKLTHVLQGYVQLRKLYTPIVERVYGKPVKGIITVRYLTRKSDVSEIVDSFGAAILRSNGKIPTFHWLGEGYSL